MDVEHVTGAHAVLEPSIRSCSRTRRDTAVTAAVSQLLVDRGRRFCFLYTDLANPTSSSIYTTIGYEPVCDSREVAFSAA